MMILLHERRRLRAVVSPMMGRVCDCCLATSAQFLRHHAAVAGMCGAGRPDLSIKHEHATDGIGASIGGGEAALDDTETTCSPGRLCIRICWNATLLMAMRRSSRTMMVRLGTYRLTSRRIPSSSTGAYNGPSLLGYQRVVVGKNPSG